MKSDAYEHPISTYGTAGHGDVPKSSVSRPEWGLTRPQMIQLEASLYALSTAFMRV